MAGQRERPDPPEWEPPDYFEPADSEESSSNKWEPPDYFEPVDTTPVKKGGSFFSSLLHPKPFNPSGIVQPPPEELPNPSGAERIAAANALVDPGPGDYFQRHPDGTAAEHRGLQDRLAASVDTINKPIPMGPAERALYQNPPQDKIVDTTPDILPIRDPNRARISPIQSDTGQDLIRERQDARTFGGYEKPLDEMRARIANKVGMSDIPQAYKGAYAAFMSGLTEIPRFLLDMLSMPESIPASGIMGKFPELPRVPITGEGLAVRQPPISRLAPKELGTGFAEGEILGDSTPQAPAPTRGADINIRATQGRETPYQMPNEPIIQRPLTVKKPIVDVRDADVKFSTKAEADAATPAVVEPPVTKPKEKPFVNPFEKPSETAITPKGEEKVTATYDFNQPGLGDQYKINGGPYHGSHRTAAGLRKLGIEVPKAPEGTEAAKARETQEAAKAAAEARWKSKTTSIVQPSGEKPLPTRSPNLDQPFFPKEDLASKKAEAVKSNEDKIFDIARDKFNMGRDLPSSKEPPVRQPDLVKRLDTDAKIQPGDTPDPTGQYFWDTEGFGPPGKEQGFWNQRGPLNEKGEWSDIESPIQRPEMGPSVKQPVESAVRQPGVGEISRIQRENKITFTEAKKIAESVTARPDIAEGFGGSGHPDSPDYVAKVLSAAGNGKAGLSIEPLKDTDGAMHVVYRGSDGSPIAVAKIVKDPSGKTMVQDMAMDKSKGLAGGRAAKAIGDKLIQLGVTEPAGTMSADATNFRDRMKKRTPDEQWKPPDYFKPSEPEKSSLMDKAKKLITSDEGSMKINPFKGMKFDPAGGKPTKIQRTNQNADWIEAKTDADKLGIDTNKFDNIEDLKWAITQKTAQETIRTGKNPLTKPEREAGAAWKPPDYFKPDDKVDPYEPQKMQVKGSGKKGELDNIAMGPEGMPPRMMDIMGNSLYTRNRPKTIIKENLQNSADEHRTAGQTKPIFTVVDRVAKHPKTGEKVPAITTRDQGRGMTPAELYTLYTDIGTTGKGKDLSASGGFGVAKAAPMLAGKYVKVESIVNENGKKVMYSFEGNPKDIKNQKVGVAFKRTVLSDKAITGLRTTTYLGADEDMYNLKEYTKNMVESSPSVTSPVHFAQNFMSDAVENYLDAMKNGEDISKTTDFTVQHLRDNMQKYEPQPAKPLQDTIDMPEATINIHYDPRGTTTDTYGLHILNKGLYQDTLSGYYSGGSLDNVPKDITADIISKVEEEDEKYPFGLNRQDVSDNVRNKINDWIKENVEAGSQKKKEDRLKALYAAMTPLPTKGSVRDTVMYDAGERLTPAERMQLQVSPIIQEVTTHFDRLIDDIVQNVDSSRASTDRGKKLEKTGLLLGEPSTYGIHIPNPDRTLTDMKSTILINWLSPMIDRNPKIAALFSTVTAMHEVAHISPQSSKGFSLEDLKDANDPRVGEFLTAYMQELDSQGGLNAGHGIEFLKRLGEVFTQFGPKQTFDAADRLYDIITDDENGVGEYNPEVQKLLQIYSESRGRPETTEDLLSPTGVKSESPKGGKGRSSNNDKNDGKGTTDVKAAVDKLMEAIKANRGLMEEQEQINRVERAKRFSAFASAKGSGAAGAAKKLGKLRGEFEKVDPAENPTLDKKETNTLFDAIDLAPALSPAEKARGFVALFKILNGDGVPVRSELAVLDDVFGHGFGNDIINMHGGLGGGLIKLTKLANTWKTMQSMFDVSAPLNQGAGLMYRTKEYGPAFREMFNFLRSKEHYNAMMTAMTEDPAYHLGREGGLFLSKPGSFMDAEEAFLDSYVGDLGKSSLGRATGIPMVAGASERAYVGFLNKLRFDVFKAMIKQAKDLGHESHTIEKDEEGNSIIVPSKSTRKIAAFINNASGRGDMGKLGKITQELNVVLWSPRMIKSRIDMLTNPKIFMDLPKGMRREGIKSLLGMASMSLLVNGLTLLAGGKVSYDILSSDFMKSRFGNRVMDPNSKLQQYIVATARILAEARRMYSGKRKKSNESTIPEIAGRFTVNKFSPAFSLANTLLTAQRYTGNGNFIDQYGNKTSVQKQIGKQFVPMFLQDLDDLRTAEPDWSEQIGLNAIMSAASAAGMGVQVYPEKKEGLLKMRKPKVQ